MYTTDFQRSVIKLFCTNIKFATEYGSSIEAEYFDTQPLRLIFKLITEYIYMYSKELDQSDLFVLIDDHIHSRGFGSDTGQLLREECKQVFKVYIKSEQFIIDQLISFVRRQKLKSAIIKSVDMIEKDGYGSYEKVLKMVDEAVSVGFGVDEGASFNDIVSLPAEYQNKYNPATLIKTGFHGYDAALQGGMAPGELHIFVAPPKTGKTTLGTNIATYNIMAQKNVFYVTLEVKELDILSRCALRLTGMSYNELMTCEPEEYVKKISAYKKYNPKLFIKYWSPHSINCLAIRSWISRLRAKNNLKPDVIIVDYDDHLLPVSGRTDDPYNASGDTYIDLVNLADYFKCPVISFAQPQRHTWDGKNLIHSYEMAHSAKKAMTAYSISSIQFPEGTDEGTIYVDIVRRGTSHVRIPVRKDLTRALIEEIK